jgi:WD40 repeat protein
MSLIRFVFVLVVFVASQAPVREQVPSRTPVITDASGDLLPPGAYARLGARDPGKKGSAATDRAFTLTFSGDGRRLLAGGLDSVLLYEVDGKKPPLRLTLAAGKGEAWTLAFSSDGKKAAAGWPDGSIGVWETAGGKRLWEKRAHGKHVHFLIFARGDRLVLSTAPGEICWSDASTGQPRRYFNLHDPEDMWAPFVTPGGQTALVPIRKHGTMQEWELASGKLRREIKGSYIPLSYSADSRSLLTLGSNDYHLLDLPTGEERNAFFFTNFTPVRPSSIESAAALSPDGRHLALIASDGLVLLLDASTGKKLLDFQSADRGVLAVAFAPDGKTLASSCPNGTILLWRVSAAGK